MRVAPVLSAAAVVIALTVTTQLRIMSIPCSDVPQRASSDPVPAPASCDEASAIAALRESLTPEKTIVVVTIGRTGSSALMTLLDRCIANASIQGENDLAAWWLYKYWLSVEGYRPYWETGPTFHEGMPFYRKVGTIDTEHLTQAALLQTIAANRPDDSNRPRDGWRSTSRPRTPRVIGFKEIRWLARVTEDAPHPDRYWAERRSNRAVSQARRAGNDTFELNQLFRGYLTEAGELERPERRLRHFLTWMDHLLPHLHVIVLTREPSKMLGSAWHSDTKQHLDVLRTRHHMLLSLTTGQVMPRGAKRDDHGKAPIGSIVYERKPLDDVRLRTHRFDHESMVNLDEVEFARLFDFLDEPLNMACARRVLERKHSY